jgi:hypothetical protein
MAHYQPDAVCFDAIQRQRRRHAPEGARLLPLFPRRLRHRKTRPHLSLGTDLAYIHFLWRFIDLPPGHPAGRHWLRSTMVW